MQINNGVVENKPRRGVRGFCADCAKNAGANGRKPMKVNENRRLA
jgi:hypothetical protein